jgi:hypothetical protein
LIHTRLSLCGNHDIFCNYTALSYVWGNPEKSKRILVDRRPLQIASNLNSALLDLRDEQRTLLLWADGVCINQRDNKEKAIQVGLMGKIYASALHTIIYLGPADSRDPKMIHFATMQEGTHVDRNAILDSLLTKEWFTRVWVFQELVFSVCPWLQYGRTRIKWDLLFNILRWEFGEPEEQSDQKIPYNGAEWLDKESYHIVRDMQRARKHHQSIGKMDMVNAGAFLQKHTGKWRPNSMAELLMSRRGLGITDPRDMIFAHVGFASDGQHEDLTVDYSKTTIQTFKGSAQYIAKLYGLSALLECVGMANSPERVRDLPSWVPDWTSKTPPKTYPGQHVQSKDLRKESPVVPILPADQGILSCMLSRFDVVVYTSPILSVQQIPQELRQRIPSVLATLDITFDESGRIYMDEKTLNLLEDRLWPITCQLWIDLIQDEYLLSIEQPPVFKFETFMFEGHVLVSVELYLLLALRGGADARFVEGKRLARMGSERLTLVPDSTQEGDIIVALYDHNESIHHYLFHPTRPGGEDISVKDRVLWFKDETSDIDDGNDDDRISWSTDESFNDSRRWPGISWRIQETQITGTPVIHGEFIGECFVDERSLLDWRPAYNYPKLEGIIVVLH